MNIAERVGVKGWCPGALRPMESGDGLIVRIRPRNATLTLAEARIIAHAATSHGNGHIDLTRRANVQIRGLSEASWLSALATLRDARLIDADATVEATRNLLISPLSGLDITELADMRPTADDISAGLAADAGLHALSSKFGFVLDGGGQFSLARDRADIRLHAIRDSSGDTVIALGLDTADATIWLGTAPIARAASAALHLARVFVDRPEAKTAGRFRHLDTAAREALINSVRDELALAPIDTPSRAGRSAPALGRLDLSPDTIAVAVAPAFGRIEAEQLVALLDAVSVAGATELRISPSRTLFVALPRSADAAVVETQAEALGLIVNAADPLLRIDACPGAPACRSGHADTRALARTLATHLTPDGPRRVHISGCRKGCARSSAAALTIVAQPEGFALIPNGLASDPVSHQLTTAEIADDPARILRTTTE